MELTSSSFTCLSGFNLVKTKAQFRPKIHLATACNETVLERRRGGVNGSLQAVASRCKPLQGVARRCKESPEIEHVKSQGPVLERGDLTIPLQPITAQNNLYVTALLRPGTVLSYFVDVFALLILLNSTTNNCVQIQI